VLPIPTNSAVAAFVGCVAALAIGIGTRSVPTLILAASGFVALAFALAVTMPLGRRVRRQRLEFAWWLGHGDPAAGGGAVIPGAVFEVRCYVRHRGSTPILLSSLEPVVPGGARVVEDDSDVLVLRARARTEFAFRLVAPAAGRVVLHGLAVTLRGPLGLFVVPLYFPNPLAIKVLPRAASRSRAGARLVSGLSIERSGRSRLRRRGGGTELYELRELVPGDPFKSIAWMASARAGKLMVREVEEEVQETRWIVLDVSGTMRGGFPGSRKLDFAVEAAATEARRAIDEGDRIGLVTVDERILSYVPPRDGPTQLIHIYDALLAATEVVDEDLTDVDDHEVAGIVGRYVRNQDGVDFTKRDRSGWDVGALVGHCRRALEDAKRDEVVASTDASATLRRFCRSRGIPLPYRPAPRDASKGPGIAEALRRAAGTTREPSSLVVVTDFDGVSPATLEAPVKLLRAHGHELSFVIPEATSFAPSPSSALEKTLHSVYGHGERRRLREARTLLGRLGVPVLSASRTGSAGLVLERARRSRRAA
jgi:uncharacterized protein (DUF58 family)